MQMRIDSYPNEGRSFECSCTRVSERAAREIARESVSRDQMAQESRVAASKGSECLWKRQDLFTHYLSSLTPTFYP